MALSKNVKATIGISSVLVVGIIWLFTAQRVGREHGSRRTVRIGLDIFQGFAPFQLGISRGVFEKRGLHVIPVVLTGTAERRTALIRGEIDAICGTVSELVLAWAQNAHVTIVASVDHSTGADGVVSRKDITSIKQLRFRKIGLMTGSPSHFYLNYLLRKNDVAITDVEILPIDANNFAAAFTDRRLAAVVTWEPWLSRLVADPTYDAHYLATTEDDPDLLVDTLAVQPNLITSKPETVKLLIDGWFDSLDYWRAHPEESDRIMADWMKVNIPEFRQLQSGLRFSDLKDNKVLFGTDGQPGPIYALVKEASRQWFISQKIDADVHPDDIIDATFIRRYP